MSTCSRVINPPCNRKVTRVVTFTTCSHCGAAPTLDYCTKHANRVLGMASTRCRACRHGGQRAIGSEPADSIERHIAEFVDTGDFDHLDRAKELVTYEPMRISEELAKLQQQAQVPVRTRRRAEVVVIVLTMLTLWVMLGLAMGTIRF